MPFHTFATGQTLPASKMNDIMKQTRVVCTSSTRPASPSVGMFILETDTYKTLEWNGVAWEQPWNMPWGLVHHASYTTSSPGNQTVNGDGQFWSTGDWSARKNRRYMVHIGGLHATADSNCTFATGLWKYGGYGWIQLCSMYTGTLASGQEMAMAGVGLWFPTQNETVSVWVKHDRISATGQVTYELSAGSLARIVVIDQGPNGAP